MVVYLKPEDFVLLKTTIFHKNKYLKDIIFLTIRYYLVLYFLLGCQSWLATFKFSWSSSLTLSFLLLLSPGGDLLRTLLDLPRDTDLDLVVDLDLLSERVFERLREGLY